MSRPRPSYVVVGALAFAGLGALAGCQLFAYIDDRPGAGSDAGPDASRDARQDGGGGASHDAGGDARPDATVGAGPGDAGDAADAGDAGDDPCASTTCPSDEVCSSGLCCLPGQLDGGTTGFYPWYLSWTLAAPAASLEVDFAVDAVTLGTKVDARIVSVAGTIDDQPFGLDFVTDYPDGQGVWTGRRLIVTLMETDDFSRLIARGTTVKSGYLDGPDPQVSLQTLYNWNVGEYRIRVTRDPGVQGATDAGAGDWFTVVVHSEEIGLDAPIGSFFMRRKGPGPASIDVSISHSTMIFQTQATWNLPFYVHYSDIPRVSIATMLRGDDAGAALAAAQYFTAGQQSGIAANTDVFYDRAQDKVVGVLGGQTPRCHPAGALFSR